MEDIKFCWMIAGDNDEGSKHVKMLAVLSLIKGEQYKWYSKSGKIISRLLNYK